MPTAVGAPEEALLACPPTAVGALEDVVLACPPQPDSNAAAAHPTITRRGKAMSGRIAGR